MRDRDIEFQLEKIGADDEEFATLLAIVELVPSSKTDFAQYKLISDIKSFTKLQSLNTKYSGLCEIISNYVIFQDLLGISDNSIKSKLEQLMYSNRQNKFIENIKPSFLNELSETHIMERASLYALSLAYFFDTYPFSIFTASEMQEINEKRNTDLVLSRLAHIPIGSYVKFEVFYKNWLTMSGHSMVIKKLYQGFAFFDPNTGEEFVDTKDMIKKIEEIKKMYKGTHMAFIDGNRYIQSVSQNIQSIIPEPTPINHPITKEIIGKLREFIALNQFDNESILRCRGTLQADISTHLIIPKTHHFSQHSRHFNKEFVMFRLKKFEDLKHSAMAYRFQNTVNTFLIENAIKDMSDIKTFDDLMGFCCLIKGREFRWFLSHDIVQQKAHALIDSSYKYKIAYSVFFLTSQKLAELIHSAKQMNDIFWSLSNYLSPLFVRPSKDELFELIQKECPTYIHNLSDLIDVLEFLDTKKRERICDTIKDRIREILSQEKGTAYDYCMALKLLSSDHQIIVIQIMLAQQPMHIESWAELRFLSEHLDTTQFAFILSSVAEQTPDLIDDNGFENDRAIMALILQLLDSRDLDKISIRFVEKFTFPRLNYLLYGLNKERKDSLVSTWLALASSTIIMSQYVSLYKEIQSTYSPECKKLLYDKMRPLFLDELLSDHDFDDNTREIGFITIVDHYAQDEEVIAKLSDYFIKTNFKHINSVVAKPIVEHLVQGLIHKDATNLHTAINLYTQHVSALKKGIQFFQSNNMILPWNECLPIPLLDRVKDIVAKEQNAPPSLGT